MGTEPKQMKEARIQLGEFEKLQEDHKGVICLSPGIGFLADIIEGDYPKTYKNIANNVLLAYKGKVVTKVKAVLKNRDSLESKTLFHWYKMMETFTESSLVDDQEFQSCKDELWVEWLKSHLQTMSPWRRKYLLEELEKGDKSD